MSELPCIYCYKDTSSTKGKEHIIPESLGCKETLPQGYVCDDCNKYFSKLDNSVLNNRPIALYIGAQSILGKKEKPRMTIGNRLSFPQKGHVRIMMDATIPAGTVCNQVNFKLEQNKEFNELYFARGIHKIAFNSFAFLWGHRAALHPRYCQLRRYIKQPYNKDELWIYAARESPNTGNFFAIFHETIDAIELRLLCFDFFVSLTGWKQEIESKLRTNGFHIIRNKGQWNNSSLSGLRD